MNLDIGTYDLRGERAKRRINIYARPSSPPHGTLQITLERCAPSVRQVPENGGRLSAVSPTAQLPAKLFGPSGGERAKRGRNKYFMPGRSRNPPNYVGTLRPFPFDKCRKMEGAHRQRRLRLNCRLSSLAPSKVIWRMPRLDYARTPLESDSTRR